VWPCYTTRDALLVVQTSRRRQVESKRLITRGTDKERFNHVIVGDFLSFQPHLNRPPLPVTPAHSLISTYPQMSPKDEESPADYNYGGYLQVKVADAFKDGRYTILRKLGCVSFPFFVLGPPQPPLVGVTFRPYGSSRILCTSISLVLSIHIQLLQLFATGGNVIRR
jgi:hypothetical protein